MTFVLLHTLNPECSGMGWNLPERLGGTIGEQYPEWTQLGAVAKADTMEGTAALYRELTAWCTSN